MGSSDYSMRLITAPTAEPVTLTEAKAHLNVEHTADDAMITAMIAAARRQVEGRTHRALVRQKWRLSLPGFCDAMDLRRYPVLSVDALNYVDGDGVSQIVGGAASPNNPSAYYTLDLATGRILRVYGATWPSARPQENAVWADFWAGYADTTVSPNVRVPEDLRLAVLLMVGDLYEHREARADVDAYANPTFDALIQPYWVPHA